jgi:hypothetical protein
VTKKALECDLRVKAIPLPALSSLKGADCVRLMEARADQRLAWIRPRHFITEGRLSLRSLGVERHINKLQDSTRNFHFGFYPLIVSDGFSGL